MKRPAGHTVEGQCTERLRNLATQQQEAHQRIYIILYIMRIFSSSELVEPQTSFTEFGGVLGIQKRLTLERTDMKLGRFN